MKKLIQLPNINPSDFYISALNGRLCQKDFRMDFGLYKPQPSILSRRKYESLLARSCIN